MGDWGYLCLARSEAHDDLEFQHPCLGLFGDVATSRPLSGAEALQSWQAKIESLFIVSLQVMPTDANFIADEHPVTKITKGKFFKFERPAADAEAAQANAANAAFAEILPKSCQLLEFHTMKLEPIKNMKSTSVEDMSQFWELTREATPAEAKYYNSDMVRKAEKREEKSRMAAQAGDGGGSSSKMIKHLMH